MRKGYVGYQIFRNYSKVVIYHFSHMTRCLMATTTITPQKGLSRKARYKQLAKHIAHEVGYAPAYRESDRR